MRRTQLLMSRRQFAFGATLLPVLAQAGSPALAQQGSIRKEIDLRIDVEGDPRWVVFLGERPDIPGGHIVGHAFVAFGQEDSQRQMSWQEGFGLYPLSSAMGGASLVMGLVPGEIRDEGSRSSDVTMSCRVSRSQFEAARAAERRWGARPDYQLIHQDCVTFTLEIAGILGLKLPPREAIPDNILLPIKHMQRLAEMNSTEDFPFGDWSSSDTARRWQLVLGLETGTWKERNSAGLVLDRPARIARQGERSFRVERDNSDEVLAFLGARDSVRRALLQRGVRPSYMTLSRSGPTTFNAQWFGLRWTLDPQGNLNTVTQPGEAPGATVTLTRRI